MEIKIETKYFCPDCHCEMVYNVCNTCEYTANFNNNKNIKLYKREIRWVSIDDLIKTLNRLTELLDNRIEKNQSDMVFSCWVSGELKAIKSEILK